MMSRTPQRSGRRILSVTIDARHTPIGLTYTRSMQGTLGLVLGVAGILFLSWLFLVTLFTPAVNYHVRRPANLASADFLRLLQSTCPSPLYERSRIEILRNGDRFYP